MSINTVNNPLPNSIIKLNEVRVGAAKPLGNLAVLSAVKKEKVSGAVNVSYLALENDQQADLKHHGGKEKAIHHYPAEHYIYWQNQLNLKSSTIKTGSFGENLSTIGLTEHNVHIGDIYRVGTALLQVSQARQPCWKLNEVFNVEDMALQVQTSLRTGWYYRVLEQGEIQAGDTFQLIDRPELQWPLIRILQILYENTLDYDALSAMTNISTLADSWKTLAKNRLTHNEVENWHYRLTTDPALK